jgi:hypothetical protein
MTDLPGLPPPRRRVIPVPPGGATAARAAGRRRRHAAAGAGAAALAVVTVAVVVVTSLGPGPPDSLQVAGNPPGSPGGIPDRVSGQVVDENGQPLTRIAVLPSDLSRVLTRTDINGGYDVPCGTDLVFAAYAPSTPSGRTFERSPGAGNHAWRRIAAHDACGRLVDIRLPAGGVIIGHTTDPAKRGTIVRAMRVSAGGTAPAPDGPDFAGLVQPDGTVRIEGLDKGRYLIEGSPGLVVDVTEGKTVEIDLPPTRPSS